MALFTVPAGGVCQQSHKRSSDLHSSDSGKSSSLSCRTSYSVCWSASLHCGKFRRHWIPEIVIDGFWILPNDLASRLTYKYYLKTLKIFDSIIALATCINCIELMLGSGTETDRRNFGQKNLMSLTVWSAMKGVEELILIIC